MATSSRLITPSDAVLPAARKQPAPPSRELSKWFGVIREATEAQEFAEVYMARHRANARRNWWVGAALELPGLLGVICTPFIGFYFEVTNVYLMNWVPYGATLNGFVVFLVYGNLLPLCIFYRKLLTIATFEESRSVRAQIEQEKRAERLIQVGEHVETAIHLGEKVEAAEEASRDLLHDDEQDNDGLWRRSAVADEAAHYKDSARRDLLSVGVMLLYFLVVIIIGFVAYPQQPLLTSDLLDLWTFSRLAALLFAGVFLFPLTLRNVERSISRRRWENGEHYVWLLISDLRRHVFVVLFAFFFILARSIAVPSLLSPVAWNQGDGVWNTTRGEPCAAVTAEYVSQNCVAPGGLRLTAWHFLEETRCHDGGWFTYQSAKDACHAARAAPNFYQNGWASMALALNVLADVLWEEAVAVTPLPDDSKIKVIMEACHQIALGCGLVFFVWMLTPELGRVSLPYHINTTVSLVNGLSWLVASVLLNLTMLSDVLALHKRVSWDLFISYRVRTEKDLAERLHDKLCAERLLVWLDAKKIDAGDDWRIAFVDGLFGSRIFTPLLSRKGLSSMRTLKADSPCDNLLLEYRIAIELYLHHNAYGRGPLNILPVLVGDRTNEIAAQLEPAPLPPPNFLVPHQTQPVAPRDGNALAIVGRPDPQTVDGAVHEPNHDGPRAEAIKRYEKVQRKIKLTGEFYTEFDIGPALDSLPKVVVKSVDEEVEKQLTRFWEKHVPEAKRGSRPPISTHGQTVRETVETLLKLQGIKMESMGKKPALEHCVRSLLLKHMKLAAEERLAEEERVKRASRSLPKTLSSGSTFKRVANQAALKQSGEILEV